MPPFARATEVAGLAVWPVLGVPRFGVFAEPRGEARPVAVIAGAGDITRVRGGHGDKVGGEACAGGAGGVEHAAGGARVAARENRAHAARGHAVLLEGGVVGVTPTKTPLKPKEECSEKAPKKVESW